MQSRGADDSNSAAAPPPGRIVVLHVRVLRGSGGGPETTILRSAAHLRDSPYWMAAAYMQPPGDAGLALLRTRAARYGCPLLEVADRGPTDLAPLRQLLALARRLDVRIWHGHDYKSNLLGLLLRRRHPMTLVSTAHGWVTRTARTPLYYAIDRWCLRRYDHVVSVSPDLDAAVAALGVPAARRTLLLNGVDEQRFRRRAAPRAAGLRLLRGVAPGRAVIGAVGRLRSEKGFDDLVRAVHGLVQAGHDVELWIAGDGPDRAQLLRLIDSLDLRERVQLLGMVEDPVTVYESLDVFALSSRREAMPNALLEAMAMGLPVVAAAVGGVPAALCDGANGLVYPTGDVAALTDRLRRLLEDAALRERLSGAARRTIEERFTFAARMAAERALYDRLRC